MEATRVGNLYWSKRSFNSS